MPKISIIVAVYNVNTEYLQKCLDSILGQTLKEIEIIIIDDGSDVNCARVCDEYAEKDDRIRLVHKKNEGVSIASNLGISFATGEFLTFVDDDDWIDPEMCEKAYNKVKQHNADAAIWLYQSARLDKVEKSYYIGPSERMFVQSEVNMLQAQILDVFAYDKIRISLAGANWCKLYHTKRLKENADARFPEGMMGGEDALFTFKALEGMRKIILFEDYLYFYRQNLQSYTKKFKPDMLKDELKMIQCFVRLVDNKKELAIPLCKNICNSYIGMCINFLFHKDNKMTVREKEKYIKTVLSYDEYYHAIKQYNKCDFSKSKKIFFFFSWHRCSKIILLLSKAYNIMAQEKKYS